MNLQFFSSFMKDFIIFQQVTYINMGIVYLHNWLTDFTYK